MPSSLSPYEVLNLSPTCTNAHLKSRYRALILKYHPDRAGPRGKHKCQRILAAYNQIVAERLCQDTAECAKQLERESQISVGDTVRKREKGACDLKAVADVDVVLEDLRKIVAEQLAEERSATVDADRERGHVAFSLTKTKKVHVPDFLTGQDAHEERVDVSMNPAFHEHDLIDFD